MSLDVCLTVPNEDRIVEPAKILIREAGQIRELTREEWDAKFPGVEPFMATAQDEGKNRTVFDANITHNLNTMAKEAGIYYHLWRPDEIGIAKAAELVDPLRNGLALMRSDPARFKKHNPPNGWGSYDSFVLWIQDYLVACEKYPEADVSVSR